MRIVSSWRSPAAIACCPPSMQRPCGRPQGQLGFYSSARSVAVVIQAEVRNEVFAHNVAQRVLELHRLDKEVVLGIDALGRIRRLEVEAQPLLDAEASQTWRACGKVHEEAEIERQRSCEDRVTAEEINLELHGITQPAEDIDIVPTLFVITAWGVIVDTNLVVDILV